MPLTFSNEGKKLRLNYMYSTSTEFFFLNLRSGIICTMYLLFLPATPLSSNFRTSLRALLKFPYPVSASSKIGIDVASLMNSMTSTTCVHEASLLSRTPS